MRADVWRIDETAIADPENGAWRPVAPLPAPQAEAVTLAHDGSIHMIGGRAPRGNKNGDWGDQTDTGAHWAYDPSRDAWDARAPLPSPRNSATGAVIDGVVYVMSGRTVAGGNTPVCEAYDPASDQWRSIAPLPAPIRQAAPRGQGGLAGGALDGKLYVFGGEWFGDNAGVYADTWEYDPKADAWRAVAPMSRPRHGLGGVSLQDETGGAIYAIGGATGASAKGTSGFVDRFTIG